MSAFGSRSQAKAWVSTTFQQPFSQQVLALGATAVLAIVFPAGLILALLLPIYRRCLGEALERAVGERGAWFWLLAIGPALAIAAAHPSPPDDLLRNLRAWTVGFDYRRMYWGSPGIQAGDYYLGFDWTIGWIDRAARLVGAADWSWFPVVLLDALGWGIGLAVVLRRQLRGAGPLAWMVYALAVMLVWLVPNFTARVVSGRPESFFALWALCALAAEDIIGLTIWVVAGMLLATWYWFFWIYLPAAALLLAPRGWQRRALLLRVVAAASVFGVGMAFWLVASHGQYLGWFVHLHWALRNRIASVGENEGLLMGLATPSVAALFALAMAAACGGRRVDGATRYTLIVLALLAAWFALPNMTRYTDSVVSLAAAALVLLAATKWPTETVEAPWAAPAAAGLTAVFVWTALILGTGARPMEHLALTGAKPGQRVLTWFGRSTYDAVYLNPGLRIAPAFEVGFSTRDVQQHSLDLGDGKVDCAWLAEQGVSWVIAPLAPIDAPAWARCLSLVKTDRDGTSVWRVRGDSQR